MSQDGTRRASTADFKRVLDNQSDKMARHDAGETRELAAANLMTKHSPEGETNRFR